MVYIDSKHLELGDRIVATSRVTKVAKGGRRLRFTVLAIVGDKNGHVGLGTGKTRGVSEVVRKAAEDTEKNLVEVPMVGSTIPYEVIGASSGSRVLTKPVIEGSEAATGESVRTVLELVGVADITSKSLGPNTSINVVRATVEGLKRLKCVEEVVRLRSRSIEESIG